MLKTTRCTILLLSAALGGMAHAGTPAVADTPQNALHALDRLGYGPRPGELAQVQSQGVDAWIEQQLHPESIAMPVELQQRLAQLPSLRLSAAELFRRYGPPARRAAGDDEAARKQVNQAAARVTEEAMQARLLRAIYSPAQLQEVMTDFWFNHFNVFRGKGLEGRIWLGAYERDAIRPYALGRFRDLLGATAKHPAMLYYLDNWQSTAPRTDLFGEVKGGLNENYAREVMELHTLGVDGGYTQKDVTELARILTGWTYLPRLWLQDGDTPFAFEPKRHDAGDKLFLGHHIGDDGQTEGEYALDLLAQSPATAHHIAYELAQYFVADQPPPALVERMAVRFQQTGGDIREMLRTLFHSPEFWAAADQGNKFKTPYRYVVSALRASGTEVRNFRPLLSALEQLGQPLYGCQTPDGYKNTEATWLNPDAMVYRLNFATALGSGRLPLLRDEASLPPLEAPTPMAAAMTPAAMQPAAQPDAPQDRPPPPDPETLRATLGNTLSPSTSAALEQAPPPLRAALLLGSPEFMRH